MGNRQLVLDSLDAFGIAYALWDHAPVHTVADCLAIPGIDWHRTELVKNVALCSRQKTAFYLMLLRHNVPFRTAVVSRALGVSRLSFAPDDMLPSLLGLEAGAVSPLGLLFDKERRVSLVADGGLRECEHLAFHPCVNTSTLVLHAGDFWHGFLKKIARTPIWVRAEGEESS